MTVKLTPEMMAKIRQPAVSYKDTRMNEKTASMFDKVFNAHQEIVQKVQSGQLTMKDTPMGEKRVRGPGKNQKTKIVTGMIFGDLIIRRKGPKNNRAPKAWLKERWRCECKCGNQILVPKAYLLRKGNPKTSCGCKEASIKVIYNREYRIWHMMHQRCFNPKHSSYKHYQKMNLDVLVHPEWLKTCEDGDGFKRFFAEVGSAPTPNHSLDRIDNRKGYIPGNLRWATSEEQRANQGDRIGGLTLTEIADLGLTPEEYVEKIIKGEVVE